MSATYPRAVSHFGQAAMKRPAPKIGEVLPDVRPVRPRRAVVRLWLPLTPLFVLLAPIPLLFAPLGYLAPPRLRPDPFFAVYALGQLLLALGGTEILIDTPDAYVRLKIL
jgi:hypothetical protein